jgi:anaerobic carbon-monoxide dehydrogenase iron sulfur subunit
MDNSKNFSRRDFLKNLSIGAGGLIIVGSLGVAFRLQGKEKDIVKGIVVDFTKCTGCRTCETICSAYNHNVEIDGETLNGLGNPWLSNIKVHWFNPDVDVPMVCSLCEDAPCIAACPVPPDLKTGNKALYHHNETGTVCNDAKRCVGCGACARACKTMRTGVISRNSAGKPFGMCSLCNGTPKCVDYCTYHALAFVELTDQTDYRKLSPEIIAQRLVKKFYEMDVTF